MAEEQVRAQEYPPPLSMAELGALEDGAWNIVRLHQALDEKARQADPEMDRSLQQAFIWLRLIGMIRQGRAVREEATARLRAGDQLGALLLLGGNRACGA